MSGASRRRIPQAVFLKSATRPSEYPEPEGRPEIAVAGRSNVGKSSLINRLVNRRQFARVSSTPGRTQLLNFFVIDGRYTLCDLPGYGYAKVPLAVKKSWGKMIESYLAERLPLQALLLLMDCRREPGEWERQLITFCSYYGRGVIPVLTKIDKLPKSKKKLASLQAAQALGVHRKKIILWSAQTGEGLQDLEAALEAQLDELPPPSA